MVDNKSSSLLNEIKDVEAKIKDVFTFESKVEIMTNKLNSYIKNTVLDDTKIIDIISQVVAKVEFSKENNNIKMKK